MKGLSVNWLFKIIVLLLLISITLLFVNSSSDLFSALGASFTENLGG